MQIEQAIFTSARTSRMDGYQLVAASPGVSANDASLLVRWGPAHDSLPGGRLELASVNFHPLADESFGVSRTVAAGAEYSGRGGARIYTHCLIVGHEALGRFAGNPFRILEAALGMGSADVCRSIPSHLPPIQLIGSASIVDPAALDRLARSGDVTALVRLLEAAIDNRLLAVVVEDSFKRLVSNLIDVLPVECRRQMSFSTGLKHSRSRPFRLIAATDSLAHGRPRRESEPLLLDLTAAAMNGDPARLENGWAALVGRLLTEGAVDTLHELLSAARPGLRLEDLDHLGRSLDSQVV